MSDGSIYVLIRNLELRVLAVGEFQNSTGRDVEEVIVKLFSEDKKTQQ